MTHPPPFLFLSLRIGSWYPGIESRFDEIESSSLDSDIAKTSTLYFLHILDKYSILPSATSDQEITSMLAQQ